MKVTIYIETTMAGPGIRDGRYGAVVEYINSKGDPVTRQVYGEEKSTTWYRSVMMAAVKALNILNRPCEVELVTGCSYVANTINNGRVETWRRSEWKKSSGEDVKNKELWQEFADLTEKHKITATFCKHHKYVRSLRKSITKEQESRL